MVRPTKYAPRGIVQLYGGSGSSIVTGTSSTGPAGTAGDPAGTTWKAPVRVATTTNGTLATAYENGDTVDGIVLATGDRLLIKNQTDGTENGIYVVNASGEPTRASDMDDSAEVVGSVVYVIAGTVNRATTWASTNLTPPVIGFGFDALTFEEFASGGGGGGATGTIGVKARRSAVQTLTTGVGASISFTATDDFDTDAFHDPGGANPERVTIPAGLGGKYLVTASAQWDTASFAGNRSVEIAVNGVSTLEGTRLPAAVTPNSALTSTVGVFNLVAGDYVTISALQNSGGNLDILEALLSVIKLDSGKVGAGVGARVHRTTNQTPITTQTAILFDGEDWDTDGFHSTSSNTDRLTIPTGLGGKYLIVANTYVTGIAANTNYVHGRITKNGIGGANIATNRVPRSPDDNTLIVLSGVADLVAGDYVQSTIESDDTSFTVNTSGTGGGGGVPSFQIMRIDTVPTVTRVACRANASTVTSLTNASYTAIAFDGADSFDSDGFHDPVTNNTRMTVPAGLGGLYLILGIASFAASAAGKRGAQLYLNGATVIDSIVRDNVPAGSFASRIEVSSLYVLAAGDYVEVRGFQDSGGALNTDAGTSRLMLTRIST